MNDAPSRLSAFLAELRRRRVFRVAAVYACVAFIIFQIIDATFDYLPIPGWVGTTLIVVLLLGFPIAVGLAWAFDLTAEGLVRTREIKSDQPKKPPRPVIGNKTLAVIAVLAVIAAAWSWWGRPGPEAALGGKSIAVLPFINMSADPEQEYFCDGITDDILTHLSKIGDLKVIGRTSVMQYKNTTKRLRDIGRELGVATLLEGSVRRADSRVRITSQLVDAKTEEHLWAETYDRDLTDIFAIQSDVAQKIAAALKATLTPEEEQRIEDRPTDNLEAYEYYLRGNALTKYSYLGGGSQSRLDAIEMYTKAVELDPTFTLAYVALSIWHAHTYYYYTDHTPERLAMAKSALDRAMALDPDQPAVHQAYGLYYYWGFRDYETALEHFNLALQNQPNNSDIIFCIGYVQLPMGKWETAAANLSKAAELDPRSYLSSAYAYLTYLNMRNWAEAERFADRCIFIAPENDGSYPPKAEVYLLSKGDIEKARGVYQEALETVGPGILAGVRSYIEILARNYQKALDIIEDEGFGYGYTLFGRYVTKAIIYSYMGRPEQAAAYFDSARVHYEELIKNNLDDYLVPQYTTPHGNLGIAYAGLGRREEAIREGKRAVEIRPLSKDAYSGTQRILTLARIYAMLGEQDAAIDQLEVLLSIPSELSVPLLKIDPLWDPLREHPRFQALVAGGLP